MPSLDPSSISPSNLTSVNLNSVIEDCGPFIPNALNTRLREVKGDAIEAAADATYGPTGDLGFRPMFKDNSNIALVQEIYDSIMESKKLPNLRPNPGIPKSPRFACVTDDTSIARRLSLDYDPRRRCLQDGARGAPVPAFYAEGTAYIFLCPSFFSLVDQPTQSHCPAVHDNRFAGDPNIFYKKYKTYTLIYQLVRFYLGRTSLNDKSDPQEEFDWNNCVRLGETDSVRNPTNFQLYVARK